MHGKATIIPSAFIGLIVAVLFVLTPQIWGIAQGAQDSDSKPNDQAAIRTPLPKGKKLVLTDGTFQIAREYKVEGDRVRYWSIERSDWEEIPASLVDWDATHKAEAEQAREAAALKARMRATDIMERTKDIDVDRSLEIKPGLFLPDAVGFYSLDGRLIYVMKQSVAVAKRSTGREVEKIMTGVPLIPSKQTLEIPDEHAALRLDSAEPEFYMRPADDRTPRFPVASRADQERPPRARQRYAPLHRRRNSQDQRHRSANLDARPRRLPLYGQ